MSLISNSGGSAAALPGTIQLFCSETPAGWRRMNDVYVDKSVFASPGARISLLPYVVTAGTFAQSALSSGQLSCVNDPESPNHVYLMYGAGLRRHDLLTGVSHPCASLVGSGVSSNAVMTPLGLFAVLSTAGTLWLYTPATDSWSQFSTKLPGVRSSDYLQPVYDAKRNRLLILRNSAYGGSAQDGVAVDLTTREITKLSWLPFATYGPAVVVGDFLLFHLAAGNGDGAGLYIANLVTETLAKTTHPNKDGGLAPLGGNRVLAFGANSGLGLGAVYTIGAEGELLDKPISFTGLENATGSSGQLVPVKFTAGPITGNNLFGAMTLAGSVNTPVLISLADLDSEVPVADIFYARKL
ncbi:hypothetical protein [Comamonas terrigena]|uniref:hypothetical protein n=1 Tax=Comamonas terrigena TaxID=32013 RepID=UPI00289F5ACA|nr:hypothetical protein [Comamonas terrigena]